jgi:hypothetical protein
MSTRRAEQRHPPLFEVQQRIVAVQSAEELPYRFANATENFCCHEPLPLFTLLFRRFDASWRRLVPSVQLGARHFKRNAMTAGRVLKLDATVAYGRASSCRYKLRREELVRGDGNVTRGEIYCPK